MPYRSRYLIFSLCFSLFFINGILMFLTFQQTDLGTSTTSDIDTCSIFVGTHPSLRTLLSSIYLAPARICLCSFTHNESLRSCYHRLLTGWTSLPGGVRPRSCAKGFNSRKFFINLSFKMLIQSHPISHDHSSDRINWVMYLYFLCSTGCVYKQTNKKYRKSGWRTR